MAPNAVLCGVSALEPRGPGYRHPLSAWARARRVHWRSATWRRRGWWNGGWAASSTRPGPHTPTGGATGAHLSMSSRICSMENFTMAAESWG